MDSNNNITASGEDAAQDKARIGSTIVEGLERFVAAVRTNHSELGPSVVIIAPEVNDFAWLDWVKDQWRCKADGDHVAEIKVQGSVLGEGAEFVALCLMRALAVQLAHERGLVPLSSSGKRYYGPKYRDAAREMGLHVDRSDDLHGWSDTGLTDFLRVKYERSIQDLEGSLVAYRLTRTPDSSTSKEGRTSAAASSGATARVDQRTIAEGKDDAAGSEQFKAGAQGGGNDASCNEPADNNQKEGSQPKRNHPKVGAKRRPRQSPKSKEPKALIEMRCDCDRPDARIMVRPGFLYTKRATCNQCGATYSQSITVKEWQ